MILVFQKSMRKRIVDGRQDECDEERMEILMEEIHNIMVEAEKNCRKLRMGNKEFSPELQAKRANVGFWQAAVKIKKRKGKKGKKTEDTSNDDGRGIQKGHQRREPRAGERNGKTSKT